MMCDGGREALEIVWKESLILLQKKGLVVNGRGGEERLEGRRGEAGGEGRGGEEAPPQII